MLLIKQELTLFFDRMKWQEKLTIVHTLSVKSLFNAKLSIAQEITQNVSVEFHHNFSAMYPPPPPHITHIHSQNSLYNEQMSILSLKEIDIP